MDPWSAFPGACFSGLSDVLKCSSGLQMAVVWLDKHLPMQLEIATLLARKLGRQIGYYMWYLELKMGPSGSVQLLHMEKPTTPNLHLYVIICDSGVKTI